MYCGRSCDRVTARHPAAVTVDRIGREYQNAHSSRAASPGPANGATARTSGSHPPNRIHER